MSSPFRLEVFEGSKGQPAIIKEQPDSSVIEDARLEAFEQGYKAGWEDSVASSVADQDKISAEFARNLRDLSFTYYEARAAIVKSWEPIIRGMLTSVLPQIARESLGQIICDDIMELSKNNSEVPVLITVSPDSTAALKHLCNEVNYLPLSVVEDPTLGEDQALIRLGESERLVDLDSVLDGFSEALAGFFEITDEVPAHG
ncbi:hypothetical protein ACFE33_14990 [Falsihalocynthiibacter sp. SS001]|uniref:hypothetical protein n=1 Tax=Falsihalocynthiibacter sp. SS001 TaxID=3349698 RepID=UPI0036D2CB73